MPGFVRFHSRMAIEDTAESEWRAGVKDYLAKTGRTPEAVSAVSEELEGVSGIRVSAEELGFFLLGGTLAEIVAKRPPETVTVGAASPTPNSTPVHSASSLPSCPVCKGSIRPGESCSCGFATSTGSKGSAGKTEPKKSTRGELGCGLLMIVAVSLFLWYRLANDPYAAGVPRSEPSAPLKTSAEAENLSMRKKSAAMYLGALDAKKGVSQSTETLKAAGLSEEEIRAYRAGNAP